MANFIYCSNFHLPSPFLARAIMLPNKQLTWLGYIEKTGSQKLVQRQTTFDSLKKIMNLNSDIHLLFLSNSAIFYQMDYRTGQIETMSDAAKIVLGINPQDWNREGINIIIDLYHKNDLKVFNEKIFLDRINFLRTIPPTEQKNYIFTYNLWLKNAKQEYVNLRQRCCYIKSDEKGNPLITMGMIFSFENYVHKENPTIQVIEKIDSKENTCSAVLKKIYSPLNVETHISAREREVLLLLAEGLTSKEIAEKMFISESTVINHRKNMIWKSGVKNVAELLTYAIKNQII